MPRASHEGAGPWARDARHGIAVATACCFSRVQVRQRAALSARGTRRTRARHGSRAPAAVEVCQTCPFLNRQTGTAESRGTDSSPGLVPVVDRVVVPSPSSPSRPPNGRIASRGSCGSDAAIVPEAIRPRRGGRTAEGDLACDEIVARRDGPGPRETERLTGRDCGD